MSDQITLHTIEYSNGRYWGVGDMLYPGRLYYSANDDASSWNASDYLELVLDGVPDELVSIVSAPAGNQEVLFAFAHNSCFSISGYDAEYDLSYSVISKEIGVVNKYCAILTEIGVFFVDTKLDAYIVTPGSLPKEISKGINLRIEEMFGGYEKQKDSLRVFRLEDEVLIGSLALQDTLLSFNTKNQVWSTKVFVSSRSPLYSFKYDTLASNSGFQDDSYWMLEEASLDRFIKLDKTQPSIEGATPNNCTFVYRTPFMQSDKGYYIGIVDVDITGYWVGNLRARIINEDNTVLATTDITYSSGKNRYSFGFLPNAGERLAVDFSNSVGDSLWISEVIIRGKEVGLAPVY